MSARTIHPFPARMAPEIALNAIPEKTDTELTILDPMCGSGTVLAAASERGHHAIGIDIDPLAVMMSTLAVTNIDAEAMIDLASDTVAAARSTSGPTPWGEDEETSRFVDYWFANKQKQQLVSLATQINALEDESLQLALRLAVSRIIVTKSSQASLAQDTSHSRPHRVRTESEYDVYDGFARSVKQLGRMLDKRSLNGTGEVVLGDARALTDVVDESVDLAITSPPYLNAIDYLRGHKLALVWFGYTIPELRKRRSSSIGAERGLSGESPEIVSTIIDLVESEVVDSSALKRPMLERFAHDCVGFAGQLSAKVKPGGKAVLVVGNSTLRGNYIKNDQIAQMAMEHAGFQFVASRERDIPPSNRYMAINAKDNDSSVTKRMRKEVVLTMAK